VSQKVLSRIRDLTIGIVVMAAIGACTSITATGSPTPFESSSGGDTSPGHTDGWISYDKAPIRFEYPPDWQFEELSYFSTMSSPLVYLSNQPMRKLCFHVQGGGTTCREWPTRSLVEGGVVLRWTANGLPAWHFSQVKGDRTTIDGHPAKITIGGSSGLCDRIGGTPMTVIVDRDARDNWYEMDACFQDSSSTDFQTEIQSLLSTVQITSG
jgi:hypothetical protein